ARGWEVSGAMGRRGVSLAVQRVFWRQVRDGVSVVDAAGVAGVSRPTGQRLFSRSGGVIPSFARADSLSPSSSSSPPSSRPSYRRLSVDERHQIAALKAANL